MKLHSLITCLVLSATNILSAQTAADPGQQTPKPGAGTAKLPPDRTVPPDRAARAAIGKLTVEVGPLERAVEKLTDAYKAVPEIFPGGKPTPMVIFGPGAREAMLDAPLLLANLADMRLVDAVALVAAEAGCILDPIYAPPGNGGEQQYIIGYCITLAPNRPVATPAGTPNPVPPLPAGKPFRMVFKSYDGDPKIGPVQNLSFQIDMIDLRQPSGFLKLGEQIPNTRFKLLKFEFKETRQAQTNEMEDVSELTIMDMDTKRTAVLVLNKVVDVAAAPGGKKNPLPAATPADTDRPIVRVYATGSLLSGNEQNLKEDVFKDLIFHALDLAGLAKSTAPELYFHPNSRVLIARTTAPAHEIIEQLVNAVRESSAGLLPNPPKP